MIEFLIGLATGCVISPIVVAGVNWVKGRISP